MNQLVKRLGLVHMVCITSGALISSGLFILPGVAHARAGPAVIVSYLLAGLFASVGLLSIAELSTAMPKAGGDYFFISRALGSGVGTVSGLLSWFSISLKAAFALIGIGALSEMVLPIDGRVTGAVFLVAFCLNNLRGAHKAANVQVALTSALLVLLVGFILTGLPHIERSNFVPFAPRGWASVFSTAGFVFVAFGAAMNVVSMAEELKDPGRNVPLGIGISMLLVTLLYVAVVTVATGVLPGESLDHSMTPISDAARAFLGSPGVVAISIGAFLAFLTTANAGIMTASRYLLALSEDQLAPAVLSRLHGKTSSPWAAILVTTGLLAGAILLPLESLVKSASAVFVFIYILASVSIIVLREGRVQNYQPVFEAPLYPYLQIFGICGFVFVLFEMGWEATVAAALLLFAALLLYALYGRRKREAESALMHLVERVTDRELITGDLEDELKDIIRKRDHIKKDRLDRLIRRCAVLDLGDDAPERSEFFHLAADNLGPRVGKEPGELAESLARRENESSTVLRPGVAIPHLLVEGEDIFEMLMARSRVGIRFSGSEEPVRAVFILISSTDNRRCHLQVLAGIARMVQAPEFDENWLSARDEDRLRDLLLLEERMRIC